MANMSNEEIITDFNSLYKAFKKSKNRRSYKDSAMYFQLNAVREIEKLREELLTHTFKVSGYTKFTVTYPKQREIQACKFRDKIVQHVLCDNILCPTLPNLTLVDNYAGQIGKGSRFACNRLRCALLDFYKQHKGYGYVYKGDIHKYYYSINHEIAKEVMHAKYPQDVWWLIDEFIDSTEGEKGIALGNQINTVVSCLFLDSFDRFVTEDLGIKYYGRYADDFYLIHEDKNYLKTCEQKMTEYLSVMKLTLNPKSQMMPLSKGIPYLGFHFYVKNGFVIIKLIGSKERTYRRKFNKLCRKVINKEIPFSNLERSYSSWLAHAEYATDQRFRLYYDRKLKELKNYDN